LRLPIDLGQQGNEARQVARGFARTGLIQGEPAQAADRDGEIGFDGRGSARHAPKLRGG
jgi:hypothetical protein